MLLEDPSSSSGGLAPPAATNSLSYNGQQHPSSHGGPEAGVGKQTYERMWLHKQEYLCSIPIVEPVVKNETSEAEALADEKKELARATDRGWELIKDLGNGHCLYYISGWWSYEFCYGSHVLQFHQLPPQPGQPPFPPQRDPAYPRYMLGQAKKNVRDRDELNSIEGGPGNDKPRAPQGPSTELQVKGDTRYLVQKFDSGTTCDLTDKPRRIEVQFHCNPNSNDVIAWIKEVTTCSYLMVVHTPRLCNDAAFLPPKDSQANIINCQRVVTPEEYEKYGEQQAEQAMASMRGKAGTKLKPGPIIVGGVEVGAGKYFSKGSPTELSLPQNWVHTGGSGGGILQPPPPKDVIAVSDDRAKGVQTLSEEELAKLNITPENLEELKQKAQELAGEDQGWKLVVVKTDEGGLREIQVIVDPSNDGPAVKQKVEGDKAKKKAEEEEKGSEETYKDEL